MHSCSTPALRLPPLLLVGLLTVPPAFPAHASDTALLAPEAEEETRSMDAAEEEQSPPLAPEAEESRPIDASKDGPAPPPAALAEASAAPAAERRARALTLTTDADRPVEIPVPVGRLAIVSAPAHGTLVRLAHGLRYTPRPGYRGQDTLVYRLTQADGRVALLSATVRVGGQPPGAQTTLKLRWNPQPEAQTVQAYRVYWGPSPYQATQRLPDLSISSGAFDPDAPAVTYRARALGLRAGARACFRLQAVNAAGPSKTSDAVCTTV